MEAVSTGKFVRLQTLIADYESGNDRLIVTFDLTNKKAQNNDDCGRINIILCDTEDLDPVTAAQLEWKSCHVWYSVLDTDVNPDFSVSLVTEDSVVTKITIEVDNDFVGTVNDYKLFGTIDGTKVLLSRGRIYVTTVKPPNNVVP